MKPIIYWNRLTNEQRAAEVGREFGVRPKGFSHGIYSKATMDQINKFYADNPDCIPSYPPYPTSVDACLALAREKGIDLKIDQYLTYYSGNWRCFVECAHPETGQSSEGAVGSDPAQACSIALLRHAGRTVDLSVEPQ